MARASKTAESEPESFAAGSGASDSARTGASVTSRYLHRQQDIVGVALSDLEDFKAASTEEFWQFAIGQFFAVGGFWLGVERLFTVTNVVGDPLFWICVVSFIAGATISYFGYRQLKRRQTRMDKIIAIGKEELAKRERMDTVGT